MSEQFTPNNPLPQEAKVPEQMAVFSPEVEAEIDRHLSKYPTERKRSAILPLMFIVQRERGYLDPPGVAYLADRLGVRITDIWEVATFYSMINTKPVGRYHLQVCRTLSCKILGAGRITGHCTERLRRWRVLALRGRMPWLLRNCADDADRLRLLRKPDDGEGRRDHRALPRRASE